jgi:hypothetical protein
MYTLTTTTPKKNQLTLPMYISETHQQLSSRAAQEAHITYGPSNKGHPADLSTSQTHAIATLCLHKPWRKQKQYHEPSQQEEEEVKTHHQTALQVTIKTPKGFETPLTLLLGEHWEDQKDQEDQEDQEDREDQVVQENPQYPLTTSYPYPQEQT